MYTTSGKYASKKKVILVCPVYLQPIFINTQNISIKMLVKDLPSWSRDRIQLTYLILQVRFWD